MSDNGNSTGNDLTAEQAELVKSTRRFDIRRIMGGLFVFYGITVFVIGLINNESDKEQTGGIPINIYTGLAMFVLGVLFFVWDRLNPVPQEDIVKSEQQEEQEKAVGEGK